MLSQLYVENIAVIQKACVDFHPGFNVFTGETGAGKSVLINSINLAMGKRADKESIRTGSNAANVILQISDTDNAKDQLEKLDIYPDDGNIIIQRDITLSGRNNCKINSKPVNVGNLKSVGSIFIDVHGQNDSYSLLSKNEHMKYIDGLNDDKSILCEYQKVFRELILIKRKLEKLDNDNEDRLRKIEILKYSIEELEKAQLVTGELEKLKEKRDMYINYEKIKSLFSDIDDIISPGNKDGLNDQLSALCLLTSKLSTHIPEIDNVNTRLESLQYEFKDCLEEIISYGYDFEYDPVELEQIEDRIDMINRLSIKYSKDESEMLAYLEECKKDLKDLEDSGYNMDNLKEQYKNKFEKVKELGEKLTTSRKKVAEKFSESVCKELKFLNMSGTIFSVAINKTSFSIRGCDEIEFLISTNPGEPLKPLSKIASGGELSRIMLAIKTVIAEHEHIATLIFDEIDTGISGETAYKVGKKLATLSKHCQVICITHLAQIASFADEHFLIKKNITDDKSVTSVEKLDIDGRKKELSRIISGCDSSKTSLDSATAMLKENGIIK